MLDNNFLKILNENISKIVGGFLGLIVALIIVIFGFWKGVFIILCILAGIFIGNRAEKHEGMRILLEKIFSKRKHF